MTVMATVQANLKQLTPEELKNFMTDGCLVLRNVFPPELSEKVIPRVCSELNLDMNNPATWPKHLVALQKVLQTRSTEELPSKWRKFTPVVVLRKELDNDILDEIYTDRYNAVIDDLCGHGRWQMRKGIGHWPILFPLFQGQTWQPIEGGWHLDGDFERLSLTTGVWGLILMHLFTDIEPGGGGTAVRLGSHHFTARILAEAGPNGLERDELIPRLMNATRHLPVKEITGNNGDLIIMHPWVVHSSSLNTSDKFRIAANKHVALYAPMNFKRKKRTEFSPVELTVVEAIHGDSQLSGTESIGTNGFTPTTPQQSPQSLQKVLQTAKQLRYINARDLVRISVLRSNPYWPFSTLNRKPYKSAVRAFANLCSNYTEIKSVYLRRALTDGSWTPALSDIDLTVISKTDVSPEAEFGFLESFWKKYVLLKKIYPMFGEIYVIKETDFDLWQKLELEGTNTHNWMLVSGTEIHQTTAPNSSLPEWEEFNQAFSFYLNYFLDLYNSKAFSSRLISFDLFRLNRKISKCLKGNSTNSSGEVHKSHIPLKIKMLCNVIEQLRNGLANNPPVPIEVNTDWWKESETKNNLLVDENAVDMAGLSQWHDHIQCVYLNFNAKMFVILKDGLDRQTLINCIKAIAETFSKEKRLPVILNVNLFKYFLQRYKPFEYGHFVSYRILAFGTDILPDIAPPDESALASQLMKEAAEILKFPFSQKFFSSAGKCQKSINFELIFNAALMIKYYLENDDLCPWYQEFLDACYTAYPDHVEKVNNLKAQSEKNGAQALYLEWFKFYKKLANEVHRSVQESKINDIELQNMI